MNDVMFGLAVAGLALATAGTVRLVWEAFLSSGDAPAEFAQDATAATPANQRPLVTFPGLVPPVGVGDYHVVATVFDKDHRPKDEVELGDFRVRVVEPTAESG